MIKYIVIFFLILSEIAIGGEIIIAPVIKKDSAAYKAAEEIAAKHFSPEVQNRIKKECKTIKPVVEEQKKAVNKQFGIEEKEIKGHEIIIFVSESMPLDLVTTYVQDARLVLKNNVAAVKVVLNGFPSKGIHHFAESVGSDVEGLEIAISGFLFKQYDIETVPAVVIDEQFVVNHPRDLGDAIRLIGDTEDHKFLKDILYVLK